MKTVIAKIDSLMDSKIVLWLVAVGGILLHGVLCFGQSIWLDEALTGSYIRMGWKELLAFTTTDVHPPLYYFIVKLGIALFGDHLYIAKLFSFLPFALILCFTATKVAKQYGNRIAFMLEVLLCTTPCTIDRNAEMRMYQWAMFFVFVFAVFVFEAVKDNSRKNWILCGIFGLLAAYTHYYALLAVAILYGILFLVNWKKATIVRNILMNAGVSVIGYLPWLVVFANQARDLKETGWWQEAGITLGQIYEYIVWPFEDNTGYEPFLFVVLLLFVLAGLVRNKQFNHRVIALAAIGTYFLLILSGVLIVLFYQPVFITRFLYPTVGVLLFAIALGISKWRTEVLCMVGVLMLFFAAKTYNSQLHYQYNEESVPRLSTFMEGIEKEESLIICDLEAVKCIAEYLFPDYRIQNQSDVEADDIGEKEVYYFVSDGSNVEEERLEPLGVQEYELLDEIYFRYHGFEIYSVR